jgi:hypothetical protein
VWGTVVCIPITLTGIFIWTLIESLHNHLIYDGSTERTATDTGFVKKKKIFFGNI